MAYLLDVETVRYQCRSVCETVRHLYRSVRTLRHQSYDAEMSLGPKCPGSEVSWHRSRYCAVAQMLRNSQNIKWRSLRLSWWRGNLDNYLGFPRTEVAKSVQSLGPKWLRTEMTTTELDVQIGHRTEVTTDWSDQRPKWLHTLTSHKNETCKTDETGAQSTCALCNVTPQYIASWNKLHVKISYYSLRDSAFTRPRSTHNQCT